MPLVTPGVNGSGCSAGFDVGSFIAIYILSGLEDKLKKQYASEADRVAYGVNRYVSGRKEFKVIKIGTGKAQRAFGFIQGYPGPAPR